MKILVIGGTRYFGRRFVHHLIQSGHQVWIISRGNTKDDFGDRVSRLIADRNQASELLEVVKDLRFDAIVDQVCMTAQQAEITLRVFSGKTDYYLMTSTMSVYPFGAGMKEESVDPLKYQPSPAHHPAEEYAEGKRAAENVFAKQNNFECGFPRFPLVVGEDDYTLRLYDHVRRVQEEVPLYFPRLKAHLSFILSEDAARALLWMLEGRKQGPYNFAASPPIVMADLIDEIEKITGKKANLLTEISSEHHSPFGVPEDWSLNTDKAAKEGFHSQNSDIWLEPLLEKLAQLPRKI